MQSMVNLSRLIDLICSVLIGSCHRALIVSLDVNIQELFCDCCAINRRCFGDIIVSMPCNANGHSPVQIANRFSIASMFHSYHELRLNVYLWILHYYKNELYY